MQHAGSASLSALDVEGVLFDIDDTLVDLEQAMGDTLQSIPDRALDHLDDDGWAQYKALFTADPQRHYERFLAGEVSFREQRIHRVRHARAGLTAEPFLGVAVEAWERSYEQTLPLHFRAYDDADALLDALDARGIPFGAVSNNVHDYQRAKLDRSGLSRIEVLVGIDTVGAAKPDPAIYLEGARLIGTKPERTLYVGDNLLLDAIGATSAGLVGVWLDRAGVGETTPPASAAADGKTMPRISSLSDVLQFLPPVR
ncbi:HAD family hydrolase [Arthrobacter echini]|uniref:HAD family hydrolase n=1 Tax=Arthrobacter echini TaxID=1529066 RepID=UPI0021CCDBDB|nr:HAD family hydrolase [Arthrobacter echini]